MTIFLIGYMASGKTTLGRALAKAVGYDFIDLDFYITQRYRKSISEIFAEKGEDEFRKIEATMLREAGEFCNVIISCGGGTPCFHDNMEFMNARGITLLLESSVGCTVRRLLTARNRRPLVEGKSEKELLEFVETHKAQRSPFYSKAQKRIDSEDLESVDAIATTVENVRKLLSL